jgi:DNA-binding transcriptional ArsR family regulator
LAVDVFGALADPVRRDLLRRLATGPARVADLAAAHRAISRPAVSKHLRLLREAGLVDVVPSGRERLHRVVPSSLHPVRELLAELTAGPPVAERHLDALELEVRRTRNERTRTTATGVATEEAG